MTVVWIIVGIIIGGTIGATAMLYYIGHNMFRNF